MDFRQLWTSLLVVSFILTVTSTAIPNPIAPPPDRNIKTTKSTTSTQSTTSTTAMHSSTSTTTPDAEHHDFPADTEKAVFVLKMEFVFNGDFDDMKNNGQADDAIHFYEQRLKQLFNTTTTLRNLTVDNITQVSTHQEGGVMLQVKTDFSVADIHRETTTLKIIVDTARKDVEAGGIDFNFESLTINVQLTGQKLEEAATKAEALVDYCDAVGTCPKGYDCIYRGRTAPVPVCQDQCKLSNKCGSRAECYYDDSKGTTACRCRDSGDKLVGSDCEEKEDDGLTRGEIAGTVIGVLGVLIAIPGLVCLFIDRHDKTKSWNPRNWCKSNNEPSSPLNNDNRGNQDSTFGGNW